MYSKPIGTEDSRGPPNRILSECTRVSLEKWSIEEGWILCKMDGLQCSINCPQFKQGTTFQPSLSLFYS
jgi:hypothetical protein